MGAKMVGCSRDQKALEGGYDITQEDVGVLGFTRDDAKPGLEIRLVA
jgi:hypothetical protein